MKKEKHVIICVACDQEIAAKVAYQSDEYDAEFPDQNLLCPKCSEILLEDRTGRQVKLDAIRETLGGEGSEATVEVTTEAEEVNETSVEEVPEAEPRICRLCVGEIPPEHPHPLHERCHTVSALVITDDTRIGEKDAKWRLAQSKRFLDNMIKHNRGVVISEAKAFHKKARMAFTEGSFLLTARLGWLARDAAATAFFEQKEAMAWLADQIAALRAKEHDVADLEQFHGGIKKLLDEGRNIKAFHTFIGNKNKLGVERLVDAAWQRLKAEKALGGVEWRLECIVAQRTPPQKAINLYHEAQRLLESDPRAAQGKAGEAIELLKPLVEEVRTQERMDFARAMQLGNRVPLEIALELREQAANVAEPPEPSQEQASSHRRRSRGDGERHGGDGKRRRRQPKKVRGNRGAEKQAAIEKSKVLDVVEPLAAGA